MKERGKESEGEREIRERQRERGTKKEIINRFETKRPFRVDNSRIEDRS